MASDKLLLNDGTSNLLLNDGSSLLLLNSVSVGVGLDGPFNRFVDLRELRREQREEIVSFEVFGAIRLEIGTIVESKIKRDDVKTMKSKVVVTSLVDNISRIHRKPLFETFGRVCVTPKSIIMSTSEYYSNLLDKKERNNIQESKKDKIKSLFDEYKEIE